MTLFDDMAIIDGLYYQEEFLSPALEAALHQWIDQQEWRTDLLRRVQHYGWRYDYRAHQVDFADRIGDLPPILDDLGRSLQAHGCLEALPDQAIINEYLPGQGIAPHIDCEPCFGPQIAMLSILSSYSMEFERVATCERTQLFLARRSVCVIQGPARTLWTHGIAKRKSDPLPGGGRSLRGRRLSITLRKVTLP